MLASGIVFSALLGGQITSTANIFLKKGSQEHAGLWRLSIYVPSFVGGWAMR